MNGGGELQCGSVKPALSSTLFLSYELLGWVISVKMQIYMYNSDDFDSLAAAIREKRTVAAMAVFFQGMEEHPLDTRGLVKGDHNAVKQNAHLT
ncbi:unnamed protein product [Boreogadus saida]